MPSKHTQKPRTQVRLPSLPHALRGSPFDLVDRGFAVILFCTFLAHLGFVLYLRGVDWPARPDTDELTAFLPDRFLRHRQPPTPKPPASVEKAPTEVASRSTPNAPPRPSPPRPTMPREALAQEVRRMGLLGLLVAKGEEPGSSLVDLLRNGAVDQAQEAAMAGVSGVAVANNDRLVAGPGLGTGTIAKVPTLGFRGAIAQADTGQRRERLIPTVLPEPPTMDSPDGGDTRQLGREMRGRVAEIRACYERVLKRNPDLAGKLTLHLTITAMGIVATTEVVAQSMDDPELERCIRDRVLRWRFTPTGQGPVEASFPLVFQARD